MVCAGLGGFRRHAGASGRLRDGWGATTGTDIRAGPLERKEDGEKGNAGVASGVTRRRTQPGLANRQRPGWTALRRPVEFGSGEWFDARRSAAHPRVGGTRSDRATRPAATVGAQL